MEEKELSRFREVVDSFGGKYEFGYSPRNISPFLTLREKSQGRIGGLVIGIPDFISMDSVNEETNFNAISGMYTEGVKHLYQQRFFLDYYTHQINRNFISEGDSIKEDLEFLMNVEKSLFQEDMKKILSRIKRKNVIYMRR